MISYCVELINRNPQLNLTTKRSAIDAVLRRICHGARNSDIKGLHDYRLLHVHRNHLAVAVHESAKSWHRSFGKILANEYGMRTYCDPQNERRLFRWIPASRN